MEDAAAAAQERAPQLQRQRVPVEGRVLQPPFAGAAGQVRVAVQVAGDAPVRDHGPLGGAGRSGGVDDVRQVLRRDAAPAGSVVRLSLDGRPVVVQQEHAQALRTQAGGVACPEEGVRQDQLHAGIGRHEAQTLGGIGGVQGDVGAAGLEDRQERDDQLGAALQQDPHARLRAHAPRAQRVRQPVRPPVQLGVGDPLLPVHQRPPPRGCAPPAARRARARIPRRAALRRRSTRPGAAGARPRPAATAPRGAAPARRPRPPAASGSAPPGARSSRPRTGPCCSRSPPPAPAPSPPAPPPGRTWPCPPPPPASAPPARGDAAPRRARCAARRAPAPAGCG